MAQTRFNWEPPSVGETLFRQPWTQGQVKQRASLSVEPLGPTQTGLCWVARFERWETERWVCLRREEFHLDREGYERACALLRSLASIDPCPRGDAVTVVREAQHLYRELRAETLARLTGRPAPGTSPYRVLIGGGCDAGIFAFD